MQSSDSVTTLHLKRTRKLTDTIVDKPETGARVFVESENGVQFQLNESYPGEYSAILALTNTVRYRLHIITSQSKQYISDYVDVKFTPPIDSVSFKREGDVTIYVSTHDPANTTDYYRWDYVETSQYHAIGNTDLGVSNGRIFFRDSTNQIYNCWHIQNSTEIHIASSTALSEDVISNYPLLIIPKDDQRIAIRYSVLVKQYAITQQAFSYFQLLQKNTERQGSIFDEQPTQLIGNIHSVDDPDEPVIGFLTAGNVQEKRLFIQNDEVAPWARLNLNGSCDTIVLAINPANWLDYNYPDPRYVPWYFTGQGFIEVLAEIPCVDCRVRGGTNLKPRYW